MKIGGLLRSLILTGNMIAGMYYGFPLVSTRNTEIAIAVDYRFSVSNKLSHHT